MQYESGYAVWKWLCSMEVVMQYESGYAVGKWGRNVKGLYGISGKMTAVF